MRWDALFADMELQLEAAAQAERADEVAEITRAERAGVGLADRLRAGTGADVTLGLRDGGEVRGRLTDVGDTWLLLADGAREHLVPVAALVTVAGLDGAVAPEPGHVARRLGLGHALRAIARDRSLVQVRTAAGAHQGRIDAVAADHLELALTFGDSGRPSGRRLTVAFAGIDQVLSSSAAF